MAHTCHVAFTPVSMEFGVDLTTVQWLSTGYMLGTAVMVTAAAFLYRRIGTRQLFAASGMFLLTGTFVCAFSVNFPMLLVGRIIQSIGTGILVPLGMNINLESAPRDRLGLYVGVVVAMTAVGPSVSIPVSGALLNIFEWRFLFPVFAAMVAVMMICGLLFLGNIARTSRSKMDIASAVLISLGLVGIIYGISSAFSDARILSPVCVGIGIGLTAAFAVRQKRLEKPFIDIRPFRIPQFTLGMAANMIAIVGIFAANILLPFYLQKYVGIDPLTASLTLFPAVAVSSFLSPAAGRIYDRFGPSAVLPLGFVCMCVSSLLVAEYLGSGNLVLLAFLYIPIICGSALIIGPSQTHALYSLPASLNPHGVVLVGMGFQIAGCIGSSVFTGLFTLFSHDSGEFGAVFAIDVLAAVLAAGFAVSLIIGYIGRKEPSGPE